jgi:hypothetical protein
MVPTFVLGYMRGELVALWNGKPKRRRRRTLSHNANARISSSPSSTDVLVAANEQQQVDNANEVVIEMDVIESSIDLNDDDDDNEAV